MPFEATPYLLVFMADLLIFIAKWLLLVLLNSFNPFHVIGFFLHPMKILESLWFSDVFRGYRKRPLKKPKCCQF